ncbi:hypothetical protein K438DRAFT_1878481 [Mycena galopus ATCC 62051]|nr:hypothetical protein K438DRAFT_1878481 [Mycena galopus ATCC 62051]
MASFASVVRFAERAKGTLERLDGAVLNAGINSWDWGVTEDGWEKMLQVNALSTGLLGVLLLPLLQRTSTLPHPLPDTAIAPHLTITGSEGMCLASFPFKSAPHILTALNDKTKFKGDDVMDRYPTSKLFDLYLAREIAALEAAKGVVVNVIAPGLCASELGRDLPLPAVALFIFKKFAFTTTQGALNLLYGVLRPTPPAAYVYACKLTTPPSWTTSSAGLATQAQVWNEMVKVWRGVEGAGAEVGRIVGVGAG